MNKTRLSGRIPLGCVLITCGQLACSRLEPSKPQVGPLPPRPGSVESAALPARPVPVQHLPAGVGSDRAVPAALASVGEGSSPELDSTSEHRPIPIVTALARARKGGKSEIAYVVPGAEELTKYQDFLERLLREPALGNPSATPLPRGFRLETLEADCQALLEEPTFRRGAAAVVFRRGEARALAVEVPHSFFDESTLAIGHALFDAAHARMLIVNTVHRYRAIGGNPPDGSSTSDEDDNASASDVAHATQSYFLSAHAAFLRDFPEGIAIQVHGFGDASAEGIDAVLSAARTTTTLEPLATRLREDLGLHVAVYPKDIRRLGGTKNAQAKRSRQQNHRFIHLELSQTLRARLLRDQRLLGEFASIVVRETH
jgi:hypothetical protein